MKLILIIVMFILVVMVMGVGIYWSACKLSSFYSRIKAYRDIEKKNERGERW